MMRIRRPARKLHLPRTTISKQRLSDKQLVTLFTKHCRLDENNKPDIQREVAFLRTLPISHLIGPCGEISQESTSDSLDEI